VGIGTSSHEAQWVIGGGLQEAQSSTSQESRETRESERVMTRERAPLAQRAFNFWARFRVSKLSTCCAGYRGFGGYLHSPVTVCVPALSPADLRPALPCEHAPLNMVGSRGRRRTASTSGRSPCPCPCPCRNHPCPCLYPCPCPCPCPCRQSCGRWCASPSP